MQLGDLVCWSCSHNIHDTMRITLRHYIKTRLHPIKDKKMTLCGEQRWSINSPLSSLVACQCRRSQLRQTAAPRSTTAAVNFSRPLASPCSSWRPSAGENTAVIKMIMIRAEPLTMYWSAAATPPFVARTPLSDKQPAFVVRVCVRTSQYRSSLQLDTGIEGELKHLKQSCTIKESIDMRAARCRWPPPACTSARHYSCFTAAPMAFIYHGNAHEAVTPAV